jgi:hypothetical protein
MTNFNQTFFGQIKEIIAPDHPKNPTKYQYLYLVVISAGGYSQITAPCIRNDPFGEIDNYQDSILNVGDKVFILFPKGDKSMGLIIGGGRYYSKPQDKAKGKYFLRRFNKVETYIDSAFNYSVKSDSGPNFQLMVDKIILDDSVGEKIVLDKNAKSITIGTKDLTIDAKGKANITVKGNLTINVSGNADIKVSKNANIKAKKIALNGEKSGITTEMSHQGVIDLITGVPVKASKTVLGDV